MEQQCKDLWAAIKAMDTIDVDDPIKQQVVSLALGYLAKEARLIFKVLGVMDGQE